MQEKTSTGLSYRIVVRINEMTWKTASFPMNLPVYHLSNWDPYHLWTFLGCFPHQRCGWWSVRTGPSSCLHPTCELARSLGATWRPSYSFGIFFSPLLMPMSPDTRLCCVLFSIAVFWCFIAKHYFYLHSLLMLLLWFFCLRFCCCFIFVLLHGLLFSSVFCKPPWRWTGEQISVLNENK